MRRFLARKRNRCYVDNARASARKTQSDGMSRTACHLQLCNMCTESPSISLSTTSALRRHRVASHPRFIFNRDRSPPLLRCRFFFLFLFENSTEKTFLKINSCHVSYNNVNLAGETRDETPLFVSRFRDILPPAQYTLMKLLNVNFKCCKLYTLQLLRIWKIYQSGKI